MIFCEIILNYLLSFSKEYKRYFVSQSSLHIQTYMPTVVRSLTINRLSLQEPEVPNVFIK